MCEFLMDKDLEPFIMKVLSAMGRTELSGLTTIGDFAPIALGEYYSFGAENGRHLGIEVNSDDSIIDVAIRLRDSNG